MQSDTLPAATLPERARLGAPSWRVVLVNGIFAPQLSDLADLPAGLSLQSGGADDGDVAGGNPFLALNGAFYNDGYRLRQERGELSRPIEIVHLGIATEPLSAHTRNEIVIGAGMRCTIIESFIGSGPYWNNAATRITLGAGAELRHILLQDESREATHLHHRGVSLGEKSRYESFTLSLGGALSRQDIEVEILGAAAHCAVHGAYLLRGTQEATIASFIDHAAPGAETREIFKGVAEDRAHGVFQGKIRVRQDAQKTDAHQLNKNLLLGERAVIDTKPELEIYADDVKCSHGATVGDLDANALFYLRARGIAEPEARRMLIEAFAAETIDLVADVTAQLYLRRHLDHWLARREG
jgi:Fe-S cluster assembly protein SufD